MSPQFKEKLPHTHSHKRACTHLVKVNRATDGTSTFSYNVRIAAGSATTFVFTTPAMATCGDADGDGAGTAAVSDADCGEGLFYNSANAASKCASTACDIGGTPTDKATCCVASLPTTQPSPLPTRQPSPKATTTKTANPPVENVSSNQPCTALAVLSSFSSLSLSSHICPVLSRSREP